MKSDDFNEHLSILGLKQGAAADLLRVTPRAVRRWQNNEQPIPGPIAELVKAWRQLSDAHIPWGPDLASIWFGDDDQIRRVQDHDKALAGILSRVARRGGAPTPWSINLKERNATLGPKLTVSFYRLANGGFSLASYRRSDIPPDPVRDQPLIEDAVAAFAQAVSKAKAERPTQGWDE